MTKKDSIHSQFGGWPIRDSPDGWQRFVGGRWQTLRVETEEPTSDRRGPGGARRSTNKWVWR